MEDEEYEKKKDEKIQVVEKGGVHAKEKGNTTEKLWARPLFHRTPRDNAPFGPVWLLLANPGINGRRR